MQKTSTKTAPVAEKELGTLPEWNLADLYSGPHAPG